MKKKIGDRITWTAPSGKVLRGVITQQTDNDMVVLPDENNVAGGRIEVIVPHALVTEEGSKLHRTPDGVLHLNKPDHYIEIIEDALGAAIEDGYDRDSIMFAVDYTLNHTTSSEGDTADHPLNVGKG
jgi:hypothetical protein